jgi:hypothetical protein
MTTEFTDKEVAALKIMAKQLADWCREDIIGAILYTGAFHALDHENDKSAVVNLAKKLMFTEEEKKRWMCEKCEGTGKVRRPKEPKPWTCRWCNGTGCQFAGEAQKGNSTPGEKP